MMPLSPTPRRLRLLIGLTVGLAGALVMSAIHWVDRHVAGSDIWLSLSAAFLGATAGGYTLAPLFGQKGPGLVVYAALGAFFATAAGAAFGGFLFGLAVLAMGGVQGEHGVLLLLPMIATLGVGLFLTTTPAGLIWLASMAGVHLIARQMRKTAWVLHGDG